MIKELVIKIYESDQCGYKYDIFDQDNEEAESLDGGHCTSDIVNACRMASEQALDMLRLERDKEHAKNMAIYKRLSNEDKEEVNQRILDQKRGDLEQKENGGDYWEGTERQYLSWALEELELNRE